MCPMCTCASGDVCVRIRAHASVHMLVCARGHVCMCVCVSDRSSISQLGPSQMAFHLQTFCPGNVINLNTILPPFSPPVTTDHNHPGLWSSVWKVFLSLVLTSS